MYIEEIESSFAYAEKVNVYKNGSVITYLKGEETFDKIMEEWNSLIYRSMPMPAFGVSLNEQTKEALNSNLWIEFDFNKMLTCNEMPFCKLLINVEKCFSGFNIIRYNSQSGYDGRCFYLNLYQKTMGNFYDFLINL